MKKGQTNWKLLGKTALFIDVSNIYYSQRTLGWQIDYQRLMSYFKKETSLTSAYFYSGIVSKNDDQMKFFQKMKDFGFTVRTKEVKWIRDKGGKVLKGKGNLDIELALDMSQNIINYNTAILFSGDSDFAPLAEFVKEKGKKIFVISARGHISRELAISATKYIPFEKMRQEFERKNHPRLLGGKSSK